MDQLQDSLKTYTEAQDAYAAYQHGGDLGPFVHPKPRFVGPPSGNPLNPPPDDYNDDLMGPPGLGPGRYMTLLEPAPRPSDQILMNESMKPPAPPPHLPCLPRRRWFSRPGAVSCRPWAMPREESSERLPDQLPLRG